MNYSLYMLTSPSGKRYIGITNDIKRRWLEHRRDAKRGSSFRIHGAIRCYGAKAIDVTVLAIGEYEYIREMEIRFISVLDTTNKHRGYNISLGGDLTSPETRIKLSEAQKRRWTVATDEEREAIKEKLRARVRTPETCAKLSAALIGKIRSDAHRENLSANNWMRGKHHTEETKEKLKAAWTPEKRKLAAARRAGKTASPEQRAKHSAASRGRKKSEKTIEKMRAAWTPERREAQSKLFTGHQLAPEHVEKAAAWHRGKKRSPEALQRIREGFKRREANKKAKISTNLERNHQ